MLRTKGCLYSGSQKSHKETNNLSFLLKGKKKGLSYSVTNKNYSTEKMQANFPSLKSTGFKFMFFLFLLITSR